MNLIFYFLYNFFFLFENDIFIYSRRHKKYKSHLNLKVMLNILKEKQLYANDLSVNYSYLRLNL